ncbi:MAG: hypothetical protein IPP17_19340 [Bacteroidetes bacterium]|nr:hypothetical protein [Bacteroidota bacterium]
MQHSNPRKRSGNSSAKAADISAHMAPISTQYPPPKHLSKSQPTSKIVHGTDAFVLLERTTMAAQVGCHDTVIRSQLGKEGIKDEWLSQNPCNNSSPQVLADVTAGNRFQKSYASGRASGRSEHFNCEVAGRAGAMLRSIMSRFSPL